VLVPGSLTSEYRLAVRWSIGAAVVAVAGTVLAPFWFLIGAGLFIAGAVSGTVVVWTYVHDRARLKAAVPPATKRTV